MIPTEFRTLPPLLPPDMDNPDNKEHLWLVTAEWRTPPVNGKQVVIRGPTPMPLARIHGFWTDGASVPLIFWTSSTISPFSMPFLCSALPHDAVYAAELFDRSTCDNLLLEWACMAGCSWYQRNAAYTAVRAAGWAVWDRHTKQSIADAREVCQVVDAGAPAVWKPIRGAL